jgi:hypothetical protein
MVHLKQPMDNQWFVNSTNTVLVMPGEAGPGGLLVKLPAQFTDSRQVAETMYSIKSCTQHNNNVWSGTATYSYILLKGQMLSQDTYMRK